MIFIINILLKIYQRNLQMKSSRDVNRSQNFQQNSRSFAQILLSSFKLKKSQTLSDLQQINELLTYFKRSQKVMLTPVYKKITKDKEKQRAQYQYIEIYNIRDNQTKFKRRPARKKVNKNDQTNRSNINTTDNNYANQVTLNGHRHDKLMFFVEQSLCLNCLVYSMIKSQKIHMCFGLKRDEIQFKNEEILQNISQMPLIDEKILKPIQISPQVQKILIPKLDAQSHSLSSFSSLISLVIEVHQQTLTFQQWVISLKIIGQLVKFIQNEVLSSLEKLQINIYSNKRYFQTTKNAIIDDLFETIYSGLSKIISYKKNSNKFPKLTQLSFNPIPYLRTFLKSNQNQQNFEFQGLQKKQKLQLNRKQIYPIEKLTLIQLPPSINKQPQFLELLNKIFVNFPKITHLTIQMSNSYSQNQFKLFNLLCSQLHKFSPYLQYLSIVNNDQKQSKQSGLRSILQFYPYLSDLKIKMCPPGITSKDQHQRQWIYMNEILWRRLHIQRLINLVRILQNRGYQRYQCMGVMEFMKPLKFPLSSNGYKK